MTESSKADWVSPRDLMPRVDAIYRHPRFQRELFRIDELERDRVWCRHGLSHLLDVARIAWGLCLEDALEHPSAPRLSRELVYAAALLHDIGRAEQYEYGVEHDVAGERIAAEILGTVEVDARFCSADRRAILAAVRGHRSQAGSPGGRAVTDATSNSCESAGTVPSVRARADAGGRDEVLEERLQRVIATADKASRACFACPARSTCNWSDAKKNLTIVA